MFSWYMYLIVSLVFSHLGFWSGNLFLIAPFPDLCLLVPLCLKTLMLHDMTHEKCNKARISCSPCDFLLIKRDVHFI